MKEVKNIEQIFKDAFSNFEAPVDSSLWQGIENSLPANPAPPSKVSFLAKQAAYLKITGAVIAVATAVTAVLYFSNKNEEGAVQNVTRINNETTKAVEPAKQKIEELNIEKSSKTEKINSSEELKTKKPATVEPVKADQSNKVEENKSVQINTLPTTKEEAMIPQPQTDKQIIYSPKTNTTAEPIKDTEVKKTEMKKPEAKTSVSSEGKILPLPGLGNMVFTPNGDGIGDWFEFDDSNLSELSVKIYSLKGYKLVSECFTHGGRWDGNLQNGNPAEEGIYLVMIQAKGMDQTNYKSTIKLQLRRN